jgi:hypothetical protein
MLSGVEPNPFKDKTMIRYQLDQGSRVTIAVHNVLGRRVATLVDAVQTPGAHSVVWDGRDSHGRTAAPGIYFCYMKTPGRAATRKIVLMR